MKIAIHHRAGSFSERWIEYCIKKNISHLVVNCYDTDIIEQVRDCQVLMWHHNHGDPKDVLFAKELLFSLEHVGIKVFPDFKTAWHFDDKVGQKYLLEALGAPFVKSYVFYDRKAALNWANITTYPKVFKLRSGAGASNVKLIKNVNECEKIIVQIFNKGFAQYNGFDRLKEQWVHFKKNRDVKEFLKVLIRVFIKPKYALAKGRERGYAYFQDFIPNNDSDIRVIIIGNKAFAIKRMVRDNDFRASGSGKIIYDKESIPISSIKTAFKINNFLKAQCVAFDFVIKDYEALVVEISFGFGITSYDFCPGYWNSEMEWQEGRFNPQEWMVEEVLTRLNINNKI